MGLVGIIGANRACGPLGSRSFRRSNQRENLAVRFNAPREPLTSGPPGTGGCTARFLISRPKWQGDLPAPVRPGALTRIYPRTTALGRFICETSTTVLRFPDSQLVRPGAALVAKTWRRTAFKARGRSNDERSPPSGCAQDEAVRANYRPEEVREKRLSGGEPEPASRQPPTKPTVGREAASLNTTCAMS